MRLVFIVMVLAPLIVAAETGYVTDKLILGLHQAEDTSDRAFRSLESGQAVEILSRDRNYAHVQLPDGTQGYVKAAYLVYEKPAKLIVAEAQAEAARLASELEEIRQAFSGPAATIEALQQKSADLQAQLDDRTAQLAEIGTQNDDLRSRQQDYRYSLPLSWVAGAIGACLIAGFLCGLWWVDQRSRKRHGGIRIY
ncbi:MAG: TIGR04211 family SH3 domain-containing protein [Proteobacteria bacterium]|nr:TIGR04211 family SH3 domain-containing protein [Pseudomonadota bacterium]